jgi:hypothetical protein
MAGASSIDKLPEVDRLRVIKALTEAGEKVDYRGIIDRLQLKCSHMALWRYHRAKVKPALERNAKAILSGMDDTNVHLDKGDLFDKQIEARKQVQSVTVQALTDDPIVQAAIAKQQRIEGAIMETLGAKQFDVYAKLEGVGLKALEMHAKAMQHPGFVASAPAQAGTTTVVCIMPSANDERMRAWQQGQVIDVKAE